MYLSEDVRMENLSDTSFSFNVTGLHEFASYTFTLAAATSVGIGNFTEPLAIRTAMAGKSVCIKSTYRRSGILNYFSYFACLSFVSNDCRRKIKR